MKITEFLKEVSTDQDVKFMNTGTTRVGSGWHKKTEPGSVHSQKDMTNPDVVKGRSSKFTPIQKSLNKQGDWTGNYKEVDPNKPFTTAGPRYKVGGGYTTGSKRKYDSWKKNKMESLETIKKLAGVPVNEHEGYTHAPLTKALAAFADTGEGGLFNDRDQVDAIKELQTSLNSWGFKGEDGEPLKVDGHYGFNTLYAVTHFQHKANLRTDGDAGPETIKAIIYAKTAEADELNTSGSTEEYNELEDERYWDPNQPGYSGPSGTYQSQSSKAGAEDREGVFGIGDEESSETPKLSRKERKDMMRQAWTEHWSKEEIYQNMDPRDIEHLRKQYPQGFDGGGRDGGSLWDRGIPQIASDQPKQKYVEPEQEVGRDR